MWLFVALLVGLPVLALAVLVHTYITLKEDLR